MATRTRERTGTSAKVIIPVRWDHSEVTSRMPATGSRTAAGCSPTSSTAANVWSAASPVTSADDHDDDGERDGGDLQPEAGAGVDDLAQLDGDEAAEAGARVDAGGVHADRCGEGGGAHAVAPASSGWVGSVCGQLEEEALEAGALGRGEPAQHDAVGHRRAGDDLGLGLDQPPVAVGGVRRQAGALQRGVEPGEVVRLDDGARSRSAARRGCPAPGSGRRR